MIFKPRKTTTEQNSSSEQESSTAQRIDEDLQASAESNYLRALLAAGLRSQPYRGAVVADMTPQQYAAMDSTAGGARSMGIDAGPVVRPETVTTGGVRGMSAAPAYDEAMASLPDDYRSSVSSFYDNLFKEITKMQKGR